MKIDSYLSLKERGEQSIRVIDSEGIYHYNPIFQHTVPVTITSN